MYYISIILALLLSLIGLNLCSCSGAIPPRGVKVMPGVAGQRLYGFVNFMDSANAEFAMMALNGVSQPDGHVNRGSLQ